MSKQRVDRDELLPVADALLELFKPLSQRVEIAGSLRRETPTAADIELVCIPRPAQPGFGQPYRDEVHAYLAASIARGMNWQHRYNERGRALGIGEKAAFLTFMVADLKVPVDVFFATRETWGMAMFVRTGPAEFGRIAAIRARKMGLRLSIEEGMLESDRGEVLWCPEEVDVFANLSLPYYEPVRRTDETAKELLRVYARTA